MLLDGILVIACGYLAYFLKRVESGYLFDMDPTLLVGVILFLMFVNMFCMGKAGFYSDRKPPGLIMAGAYIAAVVAADFSILLVGLYSPQIFDIRRLFLRLVVVSVLLADARTVRHVLPV